MSKIKNPNSPWRKPDAMIQQYKVTPLRRRIFDCRREHPEYSNAQIAKAVGCGESTVSHVLSVSGSYRKALERHA